MVKKKGVIWDFFNTKGKGAVCKYCATEYKQANSCKMEKHIKKCFKCPAGLKCILSAKSTPKSSTNLKDMNQPLTVNVDVNVGQTTQTQTHLTKAGSSSTPSPSFLIPAPKPWPSPLSATSSDSGSGTVPIYCPGSSRGMTSFLDHMDSQTNVSLKYLVNNNFVKGRPRPINK